MDAVSSSGDDTFRPPRSVNAATAASGLNACRQDVGPVQVIDLPVPGSAAARTRMPLSLRSLLKAWVKRPFSGTRQTISRATTGSFSGDERPARRHDAVVVEGMFELEVDGGRFAFRVLEDAARPQSRFWPGSDARPRFSPRRPPRVFGRRGSVRPGRSTRPPPASPRRAERDRIAPVVSIDRIDERRADDLENVVGRFPAKGLPAEAVDAALRPAAD